MLVYIWSLLDIESLDLTLLECLTFGTTLSATDPVTILAIFNQYKVDPKLYTIIFGESLLNDAVSIVMYECVILSFIHPYLSSLPFRKNTFAISRDRDLPVISLPRNRNIPSRIQRVHGSWRRIRPRHVAGSQTLVTRHVPLHRILPGRVVRIHVLLFL